LQVIIKSEFSAPSTITSFTCPLGGTSDVFKETRLISLILVLLTPTASEAFITSLKSILLYTVLTPALALITKTFCVTLSEESSVVVLVTIKSPLLKLNLKSGSFE